uniref:Uncharacterized protein n=1 Tax=Roseihalotalea indica TaxID=2867963 RepID=A0AA49JF84_9BACT|nr:hypothetical protein K4G66_22815 [Tunicatimonas sp. TK19036]
MLNLFRRSPLLPVLIVLSVVLAGIAGYHYLTGWPPLLMMLVGMVLGLVAHLLFYLLFLLLGKGANQLSLAFNAAILSTVATFWLIKSNAFRWPDQVFYAAALLSIVCAILLYYCVKKLTARQYVWWAWAGVVLVVGVVATGLYWLQQEGSDPYAEKLPPPFAEATVSTLSEQGLNNPASSGSYTVQAFTYGSGTDEKREEYADGVTYQTPTVDASRLLPEWKGKAKKWRERFWGFGVKEFPLNGRAYMPEGEGAFPLVLVVHGNHSMIDYSDDGYGYLGELLASRGFITVSVDENFINSHWSGDFRGREMPVRGWLLLKHLEQWQTWNISADHPLAGKVDMENIMLMGHSRGGEAVSIAAAFDKLPYYPDDAQETFNFNFNIKGVVAIAPTDYRYHRQITLKDVNFLSLQGSYDADESSFWGMRAYRRLSFADSNDGFKAGVYFHQANHGQFNSTWGRADFGGPMSWLLNTQPMMSGEEQREAAKVFISAFAEATLHNNREYLPLFKNSTRGRNWLPAQYYLTHFRDANTETLVNFEEDIDLATAGKNFTVQTQNLKIWREETLRSRDDGSQENNALVLGWDYGDSLKLDSLASYNIVLSDTFSLPVDTTGSMLITLAAGDFKELIQGGDQSEEKEEDEKPREEPALDASIVLTDKSGNAARLTISEVKQIAPRLKTRFTKLASLDKEMIGAEWEVQPETFHLPLTNFQVNNPDFDINQLRKITLLLDQTPYGVLLIDDIGFDVMH